MYYYSHMHMHCPPGTTPYIIQPGDNFYSLAIRFNTTVDAIFAANPNINPCMLMVGQRICMPAPPPPVTCPVGTVPYTIKAGDTFYSIARANNVSLDALLVANPQVNPDRLFIGQVICIPRPVTPPPVLPTPVPCPTLRRTNRGPDVERLQRLLVNAGFDPGPIDGIFGPRTEAAVIAFQESKGLTADGIVGVDTWTAMGVTCAPTPPPTTCPNGTNPYTIQAGDTFYNLAIRFNTTVDAIRRANPNVNPDNLQIGQVICIPGPPTPPPTTCPIGTNPYTIKAGDTFYNLSIRFNTTVDAIRRANPNVNPDNLQIGQVICMPGSPTPPACPNGTEAYTIQAGDTFFSLARRFNTTVDAIRRANPNVNPDNLQIGQRICIPMS
ncbi:LysM peptidoglycan-binding domain-containing protein [Alkaliphilus serpentinus]|uniref:LysM peptidoglycan-binding domain-containing protein n=1 Tax=Alkaliphilus serpentinus TaxID=1482731 RepID=A0A833HR61_9FIRM|nr:LysM peptidoglycan-binding domain-containing protein [Alkaliphilus serpentinus]KAB3532821.1 LysM peptidoglycan-binding domain-containing protein [Alkaliphilus serpentinus]